jgi:plastocyanin domain-containing protein
MESREKSCLIGVVLCMASLASATEIYRASADRDGVQRIQILGGNYFFRPDHLIVRANVPVELTVSKETGITPHNLVIQAPVAGIDVRADLNVAPKTIVFTPRLPGRYPFYCDKKLLFFPSHRAKGMEGVLEVVK